MNHLKFHSSSPFVHSVFLIRDLDVKSPPTIAMINHLFCHTTVNTDVFTCDKARFFRAKKQYHIGNIHGNSPQNRFLFLLPQHWIFFFTSSTIESFALDIKLFSLVKRESSGIFLVYI